MSPTQIDAMEADWSCTTDLANTWAREQGVEQSPGRGTELELRNIIERLWAKESVTRHNLMAKVDKLQEIIDNLDYRPDI